jgi:subtilase family serine protease
MIRTSNTILAAALATFVGSLSLAAPASAALTQEQIRASIVRDLVGNVVHVHDVRDLGHEAAATPVRVSLLMRVRNEAELRQLVALQSTPGSHYYKKYLSSKQFANYFSPDPATYARTIRLMQERGFHITQTFPNRGMIRATMPSGFAERYFKTHIERVEQKGVVRYMNTTAITVPDELKAVATSVVGLHSVQTMHMDHVFRRAQSIQLAQAQALLQPALARLNAERIAREQAAAHAIHPAYAGGTPDPYKSAEPLSENTPKPNPSPDPTIVPDTGTTDYTTYMGLGPGVFTGGYDFPVMHGYGGSGQGVASVLDADYLNTDAQLEFTTFGIPRTNLGTRVYTDGAPYKTTDADGAGETTLDAETIMSMAPSANYYLYLEMYFDDEGITANYEKVVSDNIVGMVSSSFGACETDDPAFGYQTDYLAMEGAAEGITFSASTGDTGGGGCGVYVTNGAPQTIKGVAIPAADFYFTGVGGTDYLFVPGVSGNSYPGVSAAGENVAGENGWTFGGGGASSINPLPTWQSATTGVATTGRNLPDVSFVADPDPPSSGEVIFDGGGAGASGGTSLASPVFAALQTEINQVEGTRNGWVNPRLYAIQNQQGYYAFHDILTGDNVFNAAGPGYDEVTGIGSIDGWLLAGEE